MRSSQKVKAIHQKGLPDDELFVVIKARQTGRARRILHCLQLPLDTLDGLADEDHPLVKVICPAEWLLKERHCSERQLPHLLRLPSLFVFSFSTCTFPRNTPSCYLLLADSCAFCSKALMICSENVFNSASVSWY